MIMHIRDVASWLKKDFVYATYLKTAYQSCYQFYFEEGAIKVGISE